MTPSQSNFGPREAAAAARALRAGSLAPGREVAAFESETARFLGLRGGAAVCSGATALTLGLRALGAGPGKEVILPAFARPSLFHAVLAAGATPVTADVQWHDMNLSVAQARRRITHRTAALVAAHAFGAPAEMENLLKLGVPVVEDLSHAFGAQDYNGRRFGSFGRLAVASFRAGALLSSGGEGGMVLSDDRRLLDAVRDQRDCAPGGLLPARLEAGMTDMQAAVGRVQLKRLPSFLTVRRRRAAAYRESLKGLPLELPVPLFGRTYDGFIVKSRRPVSDALLSEFRRRGADVRRPLQHPFFWDVPGVFPVAGRIWRRSLSLPLHATTGDAACRKAVSAVRALLL